MTSKKTQIFIFFFILNFMLSCTQDNSNQEEKLNEIANIVQEFEYIESIGKKGTSYIITYDSKYSHPREKICHSCTTEELNKTILFLEEVKDISSKLYFNDFVDMIYYDKKEGLIRVWFEDSFSKNIDGADFKDGVWKEFILKNKELIYVE